MTWEHTDFSLDNPDVIWCGPTCTHYSLARSKAKTPRDLEGGTPSYYWFIENPQTGLLKTREVVQGLPYKEVDYCMYGAPCRKRTRLWTNCTWTPRRPCPHTIHPVTARRGPSKPGRGLIQGDECSLQTVRSIPQGLTMEIMLYCTNEQTQDNPNPIRDGY